MLDGNDALGWGILTFQVGTLLSRRMHVLDTEVWGSDRYCREETTIYILHLEGQGIDTNARTPYTGRRQPMSSR